MTTRWWGTGRPAGRSTTPGSASGRRGGPRPVSPSLTGLSVAARSVSGSASAAQAAAALAWDLPQRQQAGAAQGLGASVLYHVYRQRRRPSGWAPAEHLTAGAAPAGARRLRLQGLPRGAVRGRPYPRRRLPLPGAGGRPVRAQRAPLGPRPGGAGRPRSRRPLRCRSPSGPPRPGGAGGSCVRGGGRGRLLAVAGPPAGPGRRRHPLPGLLPDRGAAPGQGHHPGGRRPRERHKRRLYRPPPAGELTPASPEGA